LTHEQLESEGWELEGNIFCKDGRACLPLYEGKMISHFDHRFGTYEGQTQAQAKQNKLPELTEEQHTNPCVLPMPQYWINETNLPGLVKDGRKVLLAFRDVTNASVHKNGCFFSSSSSTLRT